jgi:NAD-specific glutamate dehydrogenase
MEQLLSAAKADAASKEAEHANQLETLAAQHADDLEAAFVCATAQTQRRRRGGRALMP